MKPIKKKPNSAYESEGVRLYKYHGRLYYSLGRNAEHGRLKLAERLKTSFMDITIMNGGQTV